MTTQAGRVVSLFSVVAAVGAAFPMSLPEANAEPCSDVEIVFARGTREAPGVGEVGQAFVDALSAKVGGRSVAVYAVNYPATNDFDNSMAAGANDANIHIQSTAASCANTRMVLGGFSQGAGVIDAATNDLPADVADNVAAVVDFGAPRSEYADSLAPNPLPVVSPAYADRFFDLCVPNDPICFPGGSDRRAHNIYIETGMTEQGASLAAALL
ncbi:MAG: cutinase family protein [Mycobacterium sp.]